MQFSVIRVPLLGLATILDHMSDLRIGRKHERRRAGHHYGKAATAERKRVEQRITPTDLRDHTSGWLVEARRQIAPGRTGPERKR